MTRPHFIFKMYVRPVYRVHPCEELREQQARGSFGFHMFHTCPACQVIPAGIEIWGDNGHQQNHIKEENRSDLPAILRIMASRQYVTQDGRILGNRFFKGPPLYYRATRPEVMRP